MSVAAWVSRGAQVDRALAERQDHQHLGLVSARGMGDGEESASNLDEMKEEMHVSICIFFFVWIRYSVYQLPPTAFAVCT